MIITYISLSLIFIFTIIIILQYTIFINFSELTKTRINRIRNSIILLLDVILLFTSNQIILKVFWIFMISMLIALDITYSQIIYEEKLKIWEKHNEKNNRRNNNM